MGRSLLPGNPDQDRFDRSRRIGWLDLKRVANARVLMVGAGAIGNETAKNLVLSGFKDVTVVDMDHVVRSNLARCLFFSDADADGERMKAEVVAAGMWRMDPDVGVESIVAMVQDLGQGFVSGFDLVLGCLDNLLARVHLNSHCCLYEIPYIDAAMDGFNGKVQVVTPPDSPCLECAMNQSHGRIMEQRFSCTGNDVSVYVPKIGAEITTTSVVSAVQVREALKLMSGREEDVIRHVLYYNGVKSLADVYEIEIKMGCPNHENREPALRLVE
jgi:molybdopterin/thiamine biosynthesis adenylyltransferase